MLTRMKVIEPFWMRAAGFVCGAVLVALAVPPASLAQTPAPSPSQTAQASPAPATPVSPLTVEGTSRKVLEQQARQFVDAYAQPTRKLGHLARWSDVAACVAVSGLVAEQAAQFKTRIEAEAKAVGAPVAPPKCPPNIEIVFTNQPQKYVDAAAARSPAILGEKGEKTVTRPIQAWYATDTAGLRARTAGPADDGPPPGSGLEMVGHVTAERFGVTRGAEAARRCVDPGVAAHNPRMVNHIVGSPTYAVDEACPHSLFLNVLIVVDAAHMGDVSVDLTSDYLTMVALSQPKPQSLDGCLALPSVLDLYAKDCPGREAPTGLTPADKAFLTGLYSADLTVVEFKQKSDQADIAGRMVKTLDKGK
jgi:hypothetical protein